MKFDYGYSIEGQKPDVVLQLWRDPEAIETYLHAHYEGVRLGWCIYLLRDSPNILWDRLPPGRC